MAELKTKQNNSSVKDFINKIPDDSKRSDSLMLLKIFKEITGKEPKMWGDSIIGFGSYHYKSERSKQEGDWPLIGFSPRKQNLTIYIMDGFDKYKALLNNLGKHKTSVGCLYIKRLTDVDTDILKKILKGSFNQMQSTYKS